MHCCTSPGTWYLIYIPDTWQAITWYWYTWPDVATLDWILLHLTPVFHCLFMNIAFTGTWHDYYTTTRHLVFLNSCTPDLLYFWTPEIGKLLILYSWYYTPIDPCNWLIMTIRLLWTHCGHYHWTIYNKVLNLYRNGRNWWDRYSFRVYGGHTNIRQLILEILPGGHQVFSWGVLAPLLPCPPAECAVSPWVYSFGSSDTQFLFGRIISLVWACSKSRYLAVYSGLVPDTPGPLCQVCTGPILNMVRCARYARDPF